MNPLAWLRSRMSNKYRALRLYHRGMAHAKANRTNDAVGDYSRVIEMSDADPQVRAMALYNRALVLSSTGHDADAIKDLQQVLTIHAAAERVKTEARRKLLRLDRSADRAAAHGSGGTKPPGSTNESAGG